MIRLRYVIIEQPVSLPWIIFIEVNIVVAKQTRVGKIEASVWELCPALRRMPTSKGVPQLTGWRCQGYSYSMRDP